MVAYRFNVTTFLSRPNKHLHLEHVAFADALEIKSSRTKSRLSVKEQ
uniref:Uncharacterized protein n=1 Tax=Arundo donax TaxID=35708 RepID=A0A0A9HA36_ARUDO